MLSSPLESIVEELDETREWPGEKNEFGGEVPEDILDSAPENATVTGSTKQDLKDEKFGDDEFMGFPTSDRFQTSPKNDKKSPSYPQDSSDDENDYDESDIVELPSDSGDASADQTEDEQDEDNQEEDPSEEIVKFEAPDEEMATLQEHLDHCDEENPPRFHITNKEEVIEDHNNDKPRLKSASPPAQPKWDFQNNYARSVREALLIRTFNADSVDTAYKLIYRLFDKTEHILDLRKRERTVNSIVASMYKRNFDGELEAREALQAFIADEIANFMSKKSLQAGHIETQGHYLEWAKKFMDVYSEKREKLDDSDDEHQQRIRVERVNIEDEGQALVGNFSNDDEEGGGEGE